MLHVFGLKVAKNEEKGEADAPTDGHWFVSISRTEQQILILKLNTKTKSFLFVTSVFLA